MRICLTLCHSANRNHFSHINDLKHQVMLHVFLRVCHLFSTVSFMRTIVLLFSKQKSFVSDSVLSLEYENIFQRCGPAARPPVNIMLQWPAMHVLPDP